MPADLTQGIGPYRIVSQLGRGGMATVYKAYQPALDRHVAIKILNPDRQASPDLLTRFKREARIIAKLDHPNIIPIYDIEEYDGLICLIMRLIEGLSLKEALNRLKQPLAFSAASRIMSAVTDALAYAHHKSILHRDVKPSNIMLASDGNIFLTDFGLAVSATDAELNLSKGLVLGTPYYISPEQAKGEPLDQRTDIYSLGVVLYEMLTGKVPFTGDTYDVVVYHQIFSLPAIPSSVNSQITPEMDGVIVKALAKDKNDRYYSVAEMMKTFQAATQSNGKTKAVVAKPAAQRVQPAPQPTPLELTDIKSKPASRAGSRSLTQQLLILSVVILFVEIILLFPEGRTLFRNALTTLATLTESADIGRIIIGTTSAYIATLATSVILRQLRRRLPGIAFALAIAFGITLIIALALGFLVLTLLNIF